MGLKENLESLKQVSSLSAEQKTALLKDLRKIKLLTPDHANAKTAKNLQFDQYESVILHLSPADLAFKVLGKRGSLCPMASKGCKSACLNTAGRGRFNSIQESRIRKSLYFILFRDAFVSHLETEIAKLEAKAIKNGKKLVVRLNGTSDIQWENIKLTEHANIFERFNSVQFYDYTKIVRRLEKIKTIENYYVVFSAAEDNETNVLKALSLGFNVATVFNQIPDQYLGAKVINGDLHDFRFLDQGQGVIVGLKAKGKAKNDTSGFVKQVDACGVPLKVAA